MDMTGEYRIDAPRTAVWTALNDADILKRCIPGCEELEKTSETEFSARVVAKVGPVKAKFSGSVALSNIDAPNGYTISGQGQGGAAGFAKGSADVALAEDGAATVLTYTVKATVGGKLAQIGSRLIDGTARKMADQFFSRFKEALETAGEGAEAVPVVPEEKRPARGLHPLVWIAGLIALVVVILLIFGRGG